MITERPPTVLIIEDEKAYIRLVRLNLEPSGFQVVEATDAESGLKALVNEEPDLILLDIGLPDIDGVTLCRQIRDFSDVPIIMLTAREGTSNIVAGLNAGADDYITKPFSAQELLARIKACLRRARYAGDNHTAPAAKTVAYLTVDLAARRVFVDGKEVSLTPTEYRLLVELVNHAGRVLVPGYLLERVWGSNQLEPGLVWQAIHRLRRKIERDPKKPQLIRTRPGIGYILSCEEVSDGDGPNRE